MANIEFYNYTENSVTIVYEGKSNLLLPNQTITLSIGSDLTFEIKHSYQSKLTKTKDFLFKISVATIVLDSMITLSDIFYKEQLRIVINQKTDSLKNPRNLTYDYFLLDDVNGSACFIKHYITNRSNVSADIKKLERKGNFFDSIFSILIFIIAEPFFFFAYNYTNYKVLFASLMIALAVFIVVFTVVDNKLHKKRQKKKGIYSFEDGINDDFISDYFNKSIAHIK